MAQFLGVEKGVDLNAFVEKSLDRRITNFRTDDLDEIVMQRDCFDWGQKDKRSFASEFYVKRAGSTWHVYDSVKKAFGGMQIESSLMDEVLDGFTELEYEGFLMQSPNNPEALELQEKKLDSFCRISLRGRLDTKESLRIFNYESKDGEEPRFIARLEGRSENLTFFISQNKWRTILRSLGELWRDSRKSLVVKAPQSPSAAEKPKALKQ